MEAGTELRVEFRRGMRAPIVNGEITLQGCWRANCYTKPDKRWLFLVTIVDDTIQGLFAQLSALASEGAVKITKDASAAEGARRG